MAKTQQEKISDLVRCSYMDLEDAAKRYDANIQWRVYTAMCDMVNNMAIAGFISKKAEREIADKLVRANNWVREGRCVVCGERMEALLTTDGYGIKWEEKICPKCGHVNLCQTREVKEGL